MIFLRVLYYVVNHKDLAVYIIGKLLCLLITSELRTRNNSKKEKEARAVFALSSVPLTVVLIDILTSFMMESVFLIGV